ncbi:MAG: hypothetical protein AVDCRST_MAG72-689, partial [uncultured Nocardioidaceae bacterium]
MLGGAAVASAITMSGALVDAAAARASFPVNPYLKTTIPSSAELHMMNRMGCGYSRATMAQVDAAGGAQAWFEQQLDFGSIPENALTESLLSWFPRLSDSQPQIWLNHQSETHGNFDYARDLANYTMLRRVYSERPVSETMVDFWSNHLHIPT